MSFLGDVKTYFEREMDRRIDSAKNMPEDLQKRMKEDGYGRKGLIFDPFQDQGYSGGIFKPKGGGSGFINNMILKLISRRDPIISTIVHTRCAQVAAFCRPQANRFDTGFRVQLRSQEEQAEESEIKEIESFFLNTGSLEERSHEDRMSFNEFGYLIASDMLIYGHAAIEKVLNRGKTLHSFLPLSAETIYFTNPRMQEKKAINNLIQSYRDAIGKASGDPEMASREEMSDDLLYLQVINGKVVEGFSKDELIFSKIYPQGELDLFGYALSPVERAVMLISSHLQVENHQRQFFQHGVASKGLLVIQGDVTPNQLRTLQAQWTQQVTGPAAAWRTPILAGINQVQWIPMVGTSRDLEYQAYQDHLLRSIFSVMGMDPEEAGFGYLSRGQEQRAMGESSNDWKLTASRDRGLRPLLNRLESILNEEIFPAWNEAYANKYKVCFVGLDAETREEETRRLQAEVQLHTTLDESRVQAQLPSIEIGGGLILNALLLQTLQSNMPKGLFMEKFMGIEGASDRPDLQYIPDSFWFQFQQLQISLMQQRQQAEAQANGVSPDGPDGGGSPDGGDGPPEKKKSKKGDDSGEDEKDQEAEAAQAEASRQQGQAQMAAIDQFVQANAHVFKSMAESLEKKDWDDSHVEELRAALLKDFGKASDRMMKDVLEAIQEDLGSRKDEPK